MPVGIVSLLLLGLVHARAAVKDPTRCKPTTCWVKGCALPDWAVENMSPLDDVCLPPSGTVWQHLSPVGEFFPLGVGFPVGTTHRGSPSAAWGLRLLSAAR